MDLDAGAVELPFDRGRTDPTDRLLEILGGLGEHRKDRTKQGQPKPGQAGASFGNGRGRNGAQVSRQHQGPADLEGRYARRSGHRFDHHPFERPLTKLAAEQVAEESPLLLGRPAE